MKENVVKTKKNNKKNLINKQNVLLISTVSCLDSIKKLQTIKIVTNKIEQNQNKERKKEM